MARAPVLPPRPRRPRLKARCDGPRCAPWARPRPSQRRLGGTQAANDEAGFDVGHFIGWRYISSGCSTGSHTTFHPSPRSRLWTGLLWPGDIHTYTHTYIHIYIYIRSSRGPSPCHHPGLKVPATPSPAGTQPARSLAPSWSRLWRAGRDPARHPFSLIPFPPRRLPSVHLLLPTGECSGPTEAGAQSPSPYARGERPGPWSPLPIGTHAHDEIDPPGSPRFPPACHAMLDGRTARWPRSMQRRPLSGYRRTATSLRHHAHDGAPCLKAPREVKQAHAPAQSLPSCHAIPSTPSTVEDHSHTDSPTLTGLESCAQAFRGPNSILRGTQMHTQWATTGQPAKSSAPLPRCQLARTGAAPPRGPGTTTPPSQLAIGHRLGATTPQATRGPG